jgi:aquaporin Z
MAYGIGQISGCHINPAVSFGVLVAGRMTTQDFITYVIAQVLGAIAGAVVLYVILSGKVSGWNGGLGQNGWGPGYLGEYGMGAALIYEVVATFLFLVCILGVTQRGAPVGIAGLAIGLTLIAIHLFGINITGTSVNPARSLGPAIVGAGANPERLAQVWLFIVAPLIGAGHGRLSVQVRHSRSRRRGARSRRRRKDGSGAGGIGTGQAAVVSRYMGEADGVTQVRSGSISAGLSRSG